MKLFGRKCFQGLLFMILIGMLIAPPDFPAGASVLGSELGSKLYAVVISTHGNVDYPGRSEEVFQYVCTYCHSAHGGTGNLATIRNSYLIVNMSPFALTGPIVFTARTGLNSFDDGSANNQLNNVCTACHMNANRPGTVTSMDHAINPSSHIGGADHFSGDYTGQDCAVCHPHDQDGDPATIDGFMPTTGSCVGCHKQTQGTSPVRRQIVDSNGDGNGIGGDFKRSSHHISALIPTDDDCTVCHETSQHMQKKVRLYDADDSATIYALDGTDDAARYENFCLSCHDGDGAQRLPTPSQPFSDSTAPPSASLTNWSGSAHNASGFVDSCVNCHDNGHGSNKLNMLSQYNYTNDGNADDPMKEQERFCFDCHDGTPSAYNTQAEFALSSHHIVQFSQQSASGIQLECVNCHNPHANNATNKVSDPDDLTILMNPQTQNTTFCLRCHDSAPPASVSFGNYTVKGFNSGGSANVWDKSAYPASAHAIKEPNPLVQCRHCHENHGSGISGYTTETTHDLLKNTYVRVQNRSAYPAGFNICFGCHTYLAGSGKNPNPPPPDVNADAWDGEHGSHEDDGPCIYCHDPHSPYDTNEFGLVNFEYNRLYSDLTYLTNASAGFNRTGNPQCGITCHGLDHTPKGFTPGDFDTTPSGIVPLSFAQIASTTYTMETPNETLVGTVNNPNEVFQTYGFFTGNGVDTYIDFNANPDALLASTNLTVDAQLKPSGIPGSIALNPPENFGLASPLQSLFDPLLTKSLAAMTAAGNYESVIFDRGVNANYRISILRNTTWLNYKAPAGVASFAFWIRPVYTHGGSEWKVAVTNYRICPIKSDHWYALKVQWDSRRLTGPIVLMVDDRGPGGDNVGQHWVGSKNCTDRPAINSRLLVPFSMRIRLGDMILKTPGGFMIGARLDDFTDVYSGLIQSLSFYSR